MKAAVVRGPGLLAVEEVPLPKVSDYAVLCRITYGATCTATDRHIINQTVVRAKIPALLGHESVGTAIQCGKKVRYFKEGDRITRVGAPSMPEAGLYSYWGGFSEYGLAFDHFAMKEDGLDPAQYEPHTINQVIPPDIPDTTAPMLITWRETASYIRRMGVRPGMRVLVLGSGGNGLSFVCHARAAGAGEIICIGSENRRETALACGADRYFDYRSPRLADELKDAAGQGYELIIDAIGSPGQLDPVLPLIAPGAIIGIYGIEGRGEARIDPFAAAHSFTFYQDGYLEGETHQAVIGEIRDGFLKAEHFLFPTPFPLKEIGAAFEMLARREAPKALIRML